MPEIHFTTSINILLVVAGGVVALLLALFVYRFTVPPISRNLKMTLIALRGLGVFCIVLLLAEPLLSLLRRTDDPPTVILLADNSKSMTLSDKTGDRRTNARAVLQSSAVQNLDRLGHVRYGIFDTRTRFLSEGHPDSLTFAGEGTDLGQALKRANEEAGKGNVQAILVVSDGNATTGSSPLFEAEELGIPVFTIGIGDTSDQQDVLVRRVVTNSITYVGNRVPVNVTISSSGYTGQRVEVLLRGPSGVLDRRTLTLQPGTREYAVSMSFIAEEEGTRRMIVEVSQLPGEVSIQNNRSLFFTRVLKSKMKVTLVAGAPGPDVAFIRRALEQDGNIEVRSFIERKDGQFYEGVVSANTILETDCIVAVGFPGPTSSEVGMSAIEAGVAAGKGLLLVMSRTVDLEKLRRMDPVLPFTVQRSSFDEQQVFLSIPEMVQNNSLLKSTASPEVWAQLPPLFVSGAHFKAKPEADVLGLTRVQSVTTNEPLLVARNVNRRKSAALLGYGLWRWSLLSGSIPGAQTLVEEFFSNTVRWLTTREDDRPVRVAAVKELFENQEPVEFTGQVYDQTYTPIEDAEIQVKVMRGSNESQLSLNPLGNGRYEGAIEQLEEGDYSFSAIVSSGGRPLAEERGAFSVGGSNAEFQETRMNALLLQQLAARTGGNYYEPSAMETLADDIAALPGFRPREVVESREIELWNKGWMLALVLTLFALEWILRKRSGML
ncbi:MAG: vWA domain-containing protein [Bacteroidota bacterium]